MANADEVLTAAAPIGFSSAEHGNFAGIDGLLAGLEKSDGTLSRAWVGALRASRWSFDPQAVRPPTAEEVQTFIGEGEVVRRTAARTCAVMERSCIRTFDVAGLDTWIGLHARLVNAPPDGHPKSGTGAGTADGAEPDVELWSAALWRRLLAGEPDQPETGAKALFDEASRRRAGSQVIESTVLRALLALSSDAIDDAVELARRASRMAQSEALPQSEYLANLTLARVRRYSGRPHLALHILAALTRVAPPAWWGWIAWETLLAGGEPAAAPALTDATTAAAWPAAAAARDLAALLAGARTGNRATFVAAAETLEQSSAAWPDIARETRTLLAALDPLREEIPELARPWTRGETASIPCGLHGIGIPQGTESEGATTFVLARPAAPRAAALARRFLRPGLAFAPPARLLTRDSARTAIGGVRTETGVAALALLGEAGASREAFFRSVYGFPFVAHRHQAVLDVLCHRMRNLLGDAGEVRRESGDGANGAGANGATGTTGPSLSLVLKEAIMVPDMRCALPTADRVLRALATLGTTSASGAADALRMPLRTVQAVLQQLVAEGACSIERDGRRVAYKIEDTTFTEVTSV